MPELGMFTALVAAVPLLAGPMPPCCLQRFLLLWPLPPPLQPALLALFSSLKAATSSASS